MFEQITTKEKILNHGITQFLQNGGAAEQAESMFEASMKLKTSNNNGARR